MDEHKYDPLYDFLKDFIGDVTISFDDVARISGCPNGKLPPSAYNPDYPWWDDNNRHSQATFGWVKAGYKAYPDFNRQTVTFRR